MTTDTPALQRWTWGLRLSVLLPVLLLLGAAAFVSSTNGSLTALVGTNPPPADELDIRRATFHPGEISVLVRNPQQEAITIASVTVDDAIVPFTVDGPQKLSRLRSATVNIPFTWVEDDPYSIGLTSSTGIQTTIDVPAAFEAPTPSRATFTGYALIGFLVGIVPVVLGMMWLPALRRADPRWLAAFMALTAGLLTFLAIDAFSEALELQSSLPSALGGPGLIVLGVAVSFLGLSWTAHRLTKGPSNQEGVAPLAGIGLATMIAVGVGLHNLGEGLAIGSSFALGEVALGSVLVIGFMVHNVSEGLGIVAPVAEGRRRASVLRLAVLALIAGGPVIIGAWIGGFITNEILGVFFFAIAVGAALEVVVEVGRYIARRAPGGLTSGAVVGGFLAGLAIMYATGLLVG